MQQALNNKHETGNATKPSKPVQGGLFAYSVSSGLVSTLSQVDIARIKYPILSRHYLTTAQILEMRG